MLKNNNDDDKKIYIFFHYLFYVDLLKKRKEIKQKNKKHLMTRKFQKIRFFFDFSPHFRLYKQEIRKIINWINKLKLKFECDIISPIFQNLIFRNIIKLYAYLRPVLKAEKKDILMIKC